MRCPALAIAWPFRARHLWGLIALAAYLLALGAIKLLILGPGQPVRLDPPDGRAALVIVPLSVTFFYLLAAFSFGLAGDLAARQSMYPARMFTLPVTTEALAGWPMLYGAAVMAGLWLATAAFARWPWETPLPFVWPALLAASFLAWTQALTWMPYGLPGLRVIVSVLWLAVLDAVVLLAIHYEASEPLMVALLAPQLPLAFLAARYAVARARRGDVPDWRGILTRLVRTAPVLPGGRERHASPARAQAWFEWRWQGRSLPALVGILLPFELALLFVARDEQPTLVFLTLLGVLLTPPFMAGFAAATVSRPNPRMRDSYGVTPFVATRPVTSAALIAAKLKTAIWSTLAAWLLVLVATPLGLALSGTWPVVIERARHGVEIVGTPRGILIVLLGLAALWASTWKQLAQGLYVGMTGREWVVKTSLLLTLSLLIVVWPLARWIHDNGELRATLWDALPWVLAALVALKMSAAAWIATRLHDSRLLRDRTLVVGAAAWLLAVLALYGLLAWLVSTPYVPHYLLWLVAILEVPLARVSAAPLALAWNRHR